MPKKIKYLFEPPEPNRIATLVAEIRDVLSGDDIGIFVTDLKTDSVRRYNFLDQVIDRSHRITTGFKDVIDENVTYVGKVDGTKRVFSPLQGVSDRFIGSLVVSVSDDFTLTPAKKYEVEVRARLLSMEYEFLHQKPSFVEFPPLTGEFSTFSDFLEQTYSNVMEVLEYRTSMVVRAQDEELQTSLATPNIDVTLSPRMKFGRVVEQSIQSDSVSVHSHGISVDRARPWTNIDGEPITTVVVLPLNSTIFMGALILGTSLAHFVTEIELTTLDLLRRQMVSLFDAYGEIANELRQAKSEARDVALHEVGTLAQSARHKVRTQVDLTSTACQNLTDRISSGTADESYIAGKIETIVRASDQANILLDEMADQARIMSFRPKRTELRALISRAVAVEAARAEINGIDIKIPKRNLSLVCYPLFLEHAVFHLIQNSIDCFEQRRELRRRKKWISIRLDGKASNPTLTFEDNAGGFRLNECYFNSEKRAEDLEDVFEVGSSWRHVSHDPDDGRGPNGQGLSTVRQYVTMHRGSVEAKDGANGAIFVMRLEGVRDI
ncbi:MAG: ATP-binding protein [Pseudomonadota bacterium]